MQYIRLLMMVIIITMMLKPEYFLQPAQQISSYQSVHTDCQNISSRDIIQMHHILCLQTSANTLNATPTIGP